MRLGTLNFVGSSALLLFCAGCWWDDKDDTALDTAGVEVDTDTDADGDTDTDTDTDADTDPGFHGVHGTIEGTVTVTLYRYDELGFQVELPWEESCFGENFPYGDIFVTAYQTDPKTGVESYYADDTLQDPRTDGSLNTYSLSVDTDEVEEVYVYAVLDKWFNRVIEPSDPVGIYGEPIVLVDGDSRTGVDIEIRTEYWCNTGDGSGGSCPDCPPGWGGGGNYYWDGTQWVYVGGGGGCSDGTVTVGGDLNISIPYNGTGNDVGTFLMYPGSDAVWWVRPDIAVTGDADGATGDWGFTYCKNGGTYEARGVWDDNGNGLYDPSDTWGQPVDEHGAPLGSITFGETDENLSMLIPVEGSDFGMVPFVRLSGQLVPNEGTFAEMFGEDAEGDLYIILGKYIPNGDYPEANLEDEYDFEAYDIAEVIAEDSLSFGFLAPANTTVFLWASTDLDDDGSINDGGEYWACYGSDGCSYHTSESSDTGIELRLYEGVAEDTATE
jgi:hypothetical protein